MLVLSARGRVISCALVGDSVFIIKNLIML